MLIEDYIFLNEFTQVIFYIFSFAIFGGGVKFIDDAFDEKTFSKNISLLLAPLLGIFWAYTMSLSAPAATILAAIVLGVLIKGKIDNIAHKIGVICILTIVFFSGYFNFLIIPLIVITFFGVVDEVGNDWVDENNIYAKFLPTSKFVHLFFEYRFAMKLAVLFFAIIGDYSLIYFFAFLAFDVAYAFVKQVSAGILYNRRLFYDEKLNGVR